MASFTLNGTPSQPSHRKRWWSPRSIRAKLLVAFITIDLLLMLSIGSLSYFTARNALRNEALAGIEALRAARSEQIKLWFSDRERDLQALAADPKVAIFAKAAIDSLGDGKDNPDKLEKNLQAIAAAYRHQPELDDAGDNSIYSTIHIRAHDFYRQLLEINNYADILIISLNGDVVYSVSKGDDFATNVLVQPGNPLAAPFYQVLNADRPDFATFTDVTFYSPVNKPVVFFAAPLINRDTLVGVLVLELPIDTLNTLLNLRDGLGKTGETYIIGSDFLFRSDSRFLWSLGFGTTILNNAVRVDTAASRSALGGSTGTRIITSYRGVRVLSAWKPLTLQPPSATNPGGIVWALIVEKEISEVEEPARALLVSILLLSILASLGVFGYSYFISSQISNPLRQLTDAAERITSGQLGRQVNIVTQDEVGILAQAFTKMTGQLRTLIDSLEERVSARTRDLQIGSDVSRQITTVLDIDHLLQEVVILTASRFNFYVVFVYLLDDENQRLVCAAGADSEGQIVPPANRHDILIDAQPGIIALAARTCETIIVNDVEQSSEHVAHPAFPATRSELAIPMRLGSRLLGIFDLQSEQPDRFGPEELGVLKTLSEQIAIAVRNAQLFANAQAAQMAAETANQAKSVFLANMSHELRTPLNAILGFSQLMVRDSAMSPAQREYVDIISRSGEYLLQLINDVLEMSKIEAGRVTLNIESFDLYHMLTSLEGMLKVRAASRGLYLLFERSARVPQYVRTDESKLRQVLINLISNGIKFTRQGGVTVRIDYSADVRLLVEVEDTGVGIEEAELSRVFDIFTQAKSGQESQEGTGLGLPISRRFVHLMGGEISVQSEVNRGSIFTFDIRAEKADSAPAPVTGTRREVIGIAPGQPTYCILVAEDRWESRTLLVKLLEPVGFKLLTAENGQEAIDLFESSAPDLIFMDMRMPIMDGYEATRRIKATEHGQRTPIIALTASAFEHERAQILAGGCDDFIRKPFNAPEVFEKIAQHLAVRFVYKDQTSELVPVAPGQPLTADDLAPLPAEWRAQLKRAAMAANADEACALIERIRAEHSPLADELGRLVNGFRFDIIMDVAG
jgi:signal transduction histidine kinase/DNA-binding NarL/FixJ family response regulator/HAMP domain-containing protein